VSADDKARDILRNVIGASITAAHSATQAAQDFVADKSPQIRQQSRNAKMIGQFVVRMGASKAGEIVSNAKRRIDTETPVQDSPLTPQAPESTPAAEPILNYSVLSAPQIIALLPSLDSVEITSIQAYEALNRNRRTVLSAIQTHLED
jgi:hypothetical protein